MCEAGCRVEESSNVSEESVVSRRGLIAALISSALITVAPNTALAAPKAKCVRVGQKIVFGGFNYQCVKKGSKLVWKKGKRVKVVPTPAAAPTSSSTPTPTPRPTSTSPSTATPTPAPTSTRRAGFFIAKSSDLAVGQSKIFFGVDLSGKTVRYSLYRSESGVSAVDVICTHMGCLLTTNRSELVCNCHFSYFDAATGERKSGPAQSDLKTYQVSEIDGEIYILSNA